MVLHPGRDLLRFGALTFLARGEKGGERLRLRLRDAHGPDFGPRIPADRWPRSLFPRTGEADGFLTLSGEWRMYRVPFGSYPEIDRGALAGIVFELGGDIGNPPDATIYVDEIGMEY